MALFTPIASPVRISVVDQMARLNSGEIAREKFDYSYLRRHGGRYGQAALTELKRSKNADVRRQAARALDETGPYNVQTSPDTLRDRIAVYPLGQKLPDSFFAVGSGDTHNYELPGCLNYAASDCVATMLDLDGDGRKEIILISAENYQGAVFRDNGKGVWQAAGFLEGLPSKCPALMDAFRAGRLSAIAPALGWKDISIAGLRLRLRPMNGPSPPCPAP